MLMGLFIILGCLYFHAKEKKLNYVPKFRSDYDNDFGQLLFRHPIIVNSNGLSRWRFTRKLFDGQRRHIAKTVAYLNHDIRFLTSSIKILSINSQIIALVVFYFLA